MKCQVCHSYPLMNTHINRHLSGVYSREFYNMVDKSPVKIDWTKLAEYEHADNTSGMQTWHVLVMFVRNGRH